MRNIFGNPRNDVDKTRVSDDGKLYLREEELDIDKQRVQKGEVTLRKEIVEEQKMVDVPVTHEEVVIERRALNRKPSDEPIGLEESIRVPVSEEQVRVDKHTVLTGEVGIHKHAVEDTKRVSETIRREEARIEKTGDPNIVSEDSDYHLR